MLGGQVKRPVGAIESGPDTYDWKGEVSVCNMPSHEWFGCGVGLAGEFSRVVGRYYKLPELKGGKPFAVDYRDFHRSCSEIGSDGINQPVCFSVVCQVFDARRVNHTRIECSIPS